MTSSLPRPAIVALDEPLDPQLLTTEILGGKGAGLAEMALTLGLPVPPGFIITTDVCRRYMVEGWPSGLEEAIADHLGRLGGRMGRRFADSGSPLLVSVRSGAPVSMPGMMDTLLNVGMTPAIRERLADESGSAAFAADTWLRFCRMYAEIVLGVPRHLIAAEASSDMTAAGLIAAADRVRRLAVSYGGPGIPEDPLNQVVGAVQAVFRSWHSERARVFRAREGIADDMGTAVVVQAMVFGNLDDRSGTGVVFTRDPATGDPQPFGDYLARAQGEDVVAGTHAVGGLDALRGQLPEVHGELLGVLRRLEHHYRDMCDVEFTVSGGRLFVLQTRIGRRSPLAAVRIAVGMAADEAFPVSRAEAVARIDQEVLHQLAGLGKVDAEAVPLTTGLAASPGVGVGVLSCDPDRAAELGAAGTAVVLARQETSPADVHGMVGAAGLLTTLGGVASHAAVVARSWAIPAVTSLVGTVVETGGIRVGDTFVPEGSVVTVDGSGGGLYLGDRCVDGGVDFPEIRLLREWAGELDVEPGTVPAGESAAPAALREVTLLELGRTVQLKGLCTAERAAATLGAATLQVESLFEAHAAYFRTTARGMALTPEGRAWVLAEVEAERAAGDTAAIEDCYRRFMPLNDRFKRIVSEWQLAAGEQTPDRLSALLASMEELHSGFRPLVTEAAGWIRRLGAYGPRFDAALGELRAGDVSMLASPLKDSYHTVWFEYHEELIALSGRDRAVEEQSEADRQAGRG